MTLPMGLILGRATEKLARDVKYVLLADDHPIVLAGMRDLLEAQPEISVIGTATSVGELFSTLEAIRPSILILDLNLGKADGLAVLKSVLNVHEDLPVLVFSVHDERDYAPRALHAGAKGYLMKDQPVEKILAAVRRVLRGETSVNQVAMDCLRPGDPGQGVMSVEQLTDRELVIFRMIGQGFPTRGIANDLHVSIKTVEKHRENIKRKLGISAGSKLGAEAAIYVWRSDGGSTVESSLVGGSVSASALDDGSELGGGDE